MFGKRGHEGFGKSVTPAAVPQPVQPAAASTGQGVQAGGSTDLLLDIGSGAAAQVRQSVAAPPPLAPGAGQRRRPARDEGYYDTKAQVFSALIDTIDLSQLAKLYG
jgi:pilus assembly protein CpaF